jgi:hypothetical protein
MFNKYKEFRRKRALARWVVRMATAEADAIVWRNHDDGAHVFEVNYNRKNRK